MKSSRASARETWGRCGRRQGVSSLLKLESDPEIIAEAEDGIQGLSMAHQYRPNVVVTDASMLGMDGVELTRRLIRELPGIQVLGLSMRLDKSIAVAMREAGAAGYLTKGGLLEKDRQDKCTRFFVAARSKTGSTSTVMSRHKEPCTLCKLRG
jgi:DNA-binding NarL/FixJ family response regulator